MLSSSSWFNYLILQWKYKKTLKDHREYDDTLFWSVLSTNKHIPAEIIELYSDMWDWDKLSTTCGNGVLELASRRPELPWNWRNLSGPKSIHLIRKFPDKDWNWYALSSCPSCITKLDLMNAYSDKNLNWHYLSYMKPPIEVIRRNIDKSWQFEILSDHSNILDLVVEYPDKDWRWKSLSSNPGVTIEIIRKLSTEEWDWFELARNSSISLEDIRSNPDLPWAVNDFWNNPNMTLNIKCDDVWFNRNMTSLDTECADQHYWIHLVTKIPKVISWNEALYGLLSPSDKELIMTSLMMLEYIIPLELAYEILECE